MGSWAALSVLSLVKTITGSVNRKSDNAKLCRRVTCSSNKQECFGTINPHHSPLQFISLISYLQMVTSFPLKVFSKPQIFVLICALVLLCFSLYGEQEGLYLVNMVNMLPGSRVRQVTDRLVDVEPEECLRTSKFDTSI